MPEVPTTLSITVLPYQGSSYNTTLRNAAGLARLLSRIPFRATSCFLSFGVWGISGCGEFENLRCLCSGLWEKRGVWISMLACGTDVTLTFLDLWITLLFLDCL